MPRERSGHGTIPPVIRSAEGSHGSVADFGLLCAGESETSAHDYGEGRRNNGRGGGNGCKVRGGPGRVRGRYDQGASPGSVDGSTSRVRVGRHAELGVFACARVVSPLVVVGRGGRRRFRGRRGIATGTVPGACGGCPGASTQSVPRCVAQIAGNEQSQHAGQIVSDGLAVDSASFRRGRERDRRRDKRYRGGTGHESERGTLGENFRAKVSQAVEGGRRRPVALSLLREGG
mmetsp:Transcript_31468/g.59954  ORF Transcript_31468/g.59954 Transcript_31468/m.59954 type:complete len:232 (+) Transcript_31468:1748-2443(+)